MNFEFSGFKSGSELLFESPYFHSIEFGISSELFDVFTLGQFQQFAIKGPLFPPFHLDLVLLATFGVFPADVATK